MTDTEIINLFFERSEQAITELDKKHGNAVARVARNILGNSQDTEECVNDTYLGTWNAIPPHKPSPLRTFVCKIARNLATKKYHSNTAEKRNSQYDLALDELEECIPDRNRTEEIVEERELQRYINQFLGTLRENERNIFLRRYWYAEEYNEIAKRYSLNLNTVKTTLFRVRRKLKDYLEKEGVAI